MATITAKTAPSKLIDSAFQDLGEVHRNLSTAVLYEHALRRGEATLSADGPLVCLTGKRTGRSPKDKFIVHEQSSVDEVWWEGNQPFDPGQFEQLLHRVAAYLQGRELYVQDLFVCADPRYRRVVRVVTELAWHSLFARNLFIRPKPGARLPAPELTVICVPGFRAVPEIDGTRSETFIILNFARRIVLIGGTGYAGEIKKSVFTALNFYLPRQGILTMHCSANVGPREDTALFFGLSGTGKTTLSTDPERPLVGDDEHAWTDQGIFNLEGGCYAKTIRISAEHEPVIYAASKRFGTVLENVVIDPVTREIDFDDDSITENTRAAYPIDFVRPHVESGVAGHPRTIFFLTADAFGVLPPISQLSVEQAMHYFLSGYTAKVAGTEVGLTAPQATFSTCFGAPFLALPPSVYAEQLGERIRKHGARVWLVNTGWTGGPYGVGHRIPIAYTRAMVHAALDGSLDEVPKSPDPIFGVLVPERCPGVPDRILQPRNTWQDPDAYEMQARKLAAMFRENFARFAGSVDRDIVEAGPRP
jgi:phosphoenolpyruvate carboxykinase (ATP)